ncbi:MAG: hypothetical protein RLZZ15_1214 [Verrucomicrobiota bacterium]|jgi:hypothetical protein
MQLSVPISPPSPPRLPPGAEISRSEVAAVALGIPFAEFLPPAPIIAAPIPEPFAGMWFGASATSLEPDGAERAVDLAEPDGPPEEATAPTARTPLATTREPASFRDSCFAAAPGLGVPDATTLAIETESVSPSPTGRRAPRSPVLPEPPERVAPNDADDDFRNTVAPRAPDAPAPGDFSPQLFTPLPSQSPASAPLDSPGDGVASPLIRGKIAAAVTRSPPLSREDSAAKSATTVFPAQPFTAPEAFRALGSVDERPATTSHGDGSSSHAERFPGAEVTQGTPTLPPINRDTTTSFAPATLALDEPKVEFPAIDRLVAMPTRVDAFHAVSPRVGRVAIPAEIGEEKNAACVAEKIPAEKSAPSPRAKTFLSPVRERVTADDSDLGIGLAKPTPPMPAFHFDHRPAPVAASALPTPVPFADGVIDTHAAASLPPAPVAAHRAVEAVLTAADRFATGDRHAVTLRFSVGGADLDVRVELRAEQVNTTFRTDSAELRAALAQEWQAAGPETSARTVRVAPPVFVSSFQDAATGDGGSRQRDARDRRATAPFAVDSIRALRAAPPAGAGTFAALATSPTSSRRLQTIA